MAHKNIKRENVQIKIDDLVPYEKNTKIHSAEQIDLLAREIKEVGYIAPIIVDETNEILAGHGRLLALKQIGTEEVECLRITGLSEAKKKTYRIADNRISEVATNWDIDALKYEIEYIGTQGVDLDITGWSENEISSLFDEAKDVNLTKELQGVDENEEMTISVIVPEKDYIPTLNAIKETIKKVKDARIQCSDD